MTTKDAAKRTLDRFEDELRELSHWMYDHPETAFEEFETSAKLAEYLASNGFEVEYPAYDLKTAFAARAGSTGPEVVICAEIDALPEVGHACGHNIIGMAAIGAGLAVAPLIDELGIRGRTVGIAPVGCAVLAYNYFNFDFQEIALGRQTYLDHKCYFHVLLEKKL